jgi:hypothetical protein
MDANRTGSLRPPGARASLLTRVRWALRRTGAEPPNDVDERMRKVKAELEEARRLDGSSPPQGPP